jgi:hypothetical protein
MAVIHLKDEEEDDNWARNPPHLDGVPDMSALIHLEEPVMIHF